MLALLIVLGFISYMIIGIFSAGCNDKEIDEPGFWMWLIAWPIILIILFFIFIWEAGRGI